MNLKNKIREIVPVWFQVFVKNFLMKTSLGRRCLLFVYRGGPKPVHPVYDINLDGRKILRLFRDHGICWDCNNQIPWILQVFLQFHHLQSDSKIAVFDFLKNNVKRDALIFETGCGSAWILLWLAQNGFTNLHGSDIQPEAIAIGRDLAALANAKVEIWEDNGFSPKHVPDKCGVIMAIVWLYSAWGGNYSSENQDLKNQNHLELLRNFISTYSSKVMPGGYFIFEVADKLSNLKFVDSGIYPVRHSEEEVCAVLEKENFLVIKRNIEISHQIISTYFAQKKIF